ncbi:hypothetical protein GUJ93_ZPchr0004g40096 [Zizania palustris]|uniref:Uncharacterized protein n=1 Tax=Zizania palustris TaxID=103762 RepID=A0A8J5RZN8_ZIZPA|nr:hypothetical protein GUJ93_ZPchr0004g39976 [Zizania palustris]KAG8064011.1 hypothetical protein GUJ93_ZPchr0004g40096 [Zizania palustris]
MRGHDRVGVDGQPPLPFPRLTDITSPPLLPWPSHRVGSPENLSPFLSTTVASFSDLASPRRRGRQIHPASAPPKVLFIAAGR